MQVKWRMYPLFTGQPACPLLPLVVLSSLLCTTCDCEQPSRLLVLGGNLGKLERGNQNGMRWSPLNRFGFQTCVHPELFLWSFCFPSCAGQIGWGSITEAKKLFLLIGNYPKSLWCLSIFSTVHCRETTWFLPAGPSEQTGHPAQPSLSLEGNKSTRGSKACAAHLVQTAACPCLGTEVGGGAAVPAWRLFPTAIKIFMSLRSGFSDANLLCQRKMLL